MSSRVTITQVAREAGVSIKTVSNVLNDTGNMRQETRAHVQEVMEKLGYHVNLAARSMRTGATKLIGLGIPDFSQPFNPYLTDSIIQAARERGYGVITSTYGFHNQAIESILPQTHKLPADGWIFFPNCAVEHDSAIFSQPYPIVLASDFSAFNKVDSVAMHSYKAVEEVIKSLFTKGKKRIAFVGAPLQREEESDDEYIHRIQDSQFGTLELRSKAYCDALRAHGVEVNMRYLFQCMYLDHKNGTESIQRMAARVRSGDIELPDAIVCCNDAIALGVIHGCAREKINIPDDVEIVGFDNVPEAHYSNPTLTSIDPHVDEYAEKAVDFLIERIEGYRGPARRYMSGCEIQKRQSATW